VARSVLPQGFWVGVAEAYNEQFWLSVTNKTLGTYWGNCVKDGCKNERRARRRLG
jgi:hypothetical protein